MQRLETAIEQRTAELVSEATGEPVALAQLAEAPKGERASQS
jgi:hypothetical protein